MRSFLFTFCCFSVVRLDASEVLETNGHVGGNVSIHCFSSRSPVNISELYSINFCKDVCSDENTIIQMEKAGSAMKRDLRYSVELDGGDGVFTVTINHLRKTDAGRYLCGLMRTFNVIYQEVSLKVVDASTVPAGSFPSPNTTRQTGLQTPRGSFPSSIEESNVTVMPPPSERKRRQKEANNFTDMMVVIIVSGSLAFLVCAIIPLIFYRHWRTLEGQNRMTAGKNEDDCCQENVETASTQFAVGVQTSEIKDNPDSGADVNVTYDAVYEGLDPKNIE